MVFSVEVKAFFIPELKSGGRRLRRQPESQAVSMIGKSEVPE